MKAKARKVVFIEPYKYEFKHWLLALNPIEWRRFIFFKEDFPHKTQRFQNNKGGITQAIIT